MSIQHLGAMTWSEVKEFIHDRVVALLPLGSIQAHGPHLPLNTDIVISVEMAKRAAKKISEKSGDVLVCPPIAFSTAEFGRAFSGTVHVAPEAYLAYLMGILEEIQGMGVKRAVFVTCHIDPSHLGALRRFVGEAPSVFPAEGLRVIFPDIMGRPWVQRMPEEFRDGREHAGRFETSCMMALQGDKVREEIRRGLERNSSGYTRARLAGKQGFEECGATQAYFGDPAAATAEEGEKFLETLSAIVSDAALEA